MPKFDKPDSPNIIWGVNALEEDLTRPDDSYIQTGWTQVKPPYEYENYSMNKLYQGFAYYNQLGFPEWDSVTEYQSGKSYVQGSNNRVYKCIQTNTNRNPAASGNEAWWEVFEGNRQSTTTSRGTVELATDAETNTGTSTTLAITPASLFSSLGSGILGNSGSFDVPANVSGTKITFTVQWGRDVDRGDSVTTINFPKPFPNQCFVVVPSEFNASQSGAFRIHRVSEFTNTSFTSQNDSGNSTEDLFTWIAIGY